VRGRVTNRINQDLGLPRNAPFVSAFTLTPRRFASRFRLHSSVFALERALFKPPNAKQRKRERGWAFLGKSFLRCATWRAARRIRDGGLERGLEIYWGCREIY